MESSSGGCDSQEQQTEHEIDVQQLSASASTTSFQETSMI